MRCIPIPGVRLLLVVGAFVVSAVTATLAEAAEGRCLIAVKGHTYLKGDCNISVEQGGSFKVGVGETLQVQIFRLCRCLIPSREKGVDTGTASRPRTTPTRTSAR